VEGCDGKKMRIAFLAGLSDEKLRQKLAPLSTASNVARIDLFRRNGAEDLPEKVEWRPVPHALRNIEPAAELARALDILANAGKYDAIIGCFQRWHGVWARVAGKTWKVPVIQLVITSVEWNLERPLCKKVMFDATACGVRGETSKRALRDAGYEGPLEVIHNAFDGWRRHRGSAETAPWRHDIVAAADFAEEKDYPWMLEILAELKKSVPGFKAALCGAELAEKLAAPAKKLGLADNIDFTGRLNEAELAKTMATAKRFLSTSKTEGLPQAALEAISIGLPCALTDVGDCRTVVGDDGTGGTLVRHGDTKTMVGTLVSALRASPAELADASKKAEKRFAELAPDFTEGKIAERWDSLLDATIRAWRLGSRAGNLKR